MSYTQGHSLKTDLNWLRVFIESIPLDEASQEHGLWQGEAPKRSLEAIERVIEYCTPIPVTERLPKPEAQTLPNTDAPYLSEEVLVYQSGMRDWTFGMYDHNEKSWLTDGFGGWSPTAGITYWREKPPAPE